MPCASSIFVHRHPRSFSRPSNRAAVRLLHPARGRYIYHVADYRLNIQIRQQCAAFRRGLFDLINQEWLIMFSPQELQILISGKESDIDIDDLRAHTHYSAGYHDKHATIVMFWRVVEGRVQRLGHIPSTRHRRRTPRQ